MSETAPKRLLILGGTSQARDLAGRVAGDARFQTTLSLAGRTQQPLEQGVPTRSGGFGGPQGLADYLRTSSIDLMVDATHPYAQQMTQNAHLASQMSQVPCLHLSRPPWQQESGENWTVVPDIAAAVAALPPGARAFTATGRGSLTAFALRRDIHTLLRVIDPPGQDYPGSGEFVVARPPFSVEAEIRELRRHRATHLVVKNAGGTAARTKLTAAAQLGIPIIIVERGELPPGVETVETVDQVMRWLDERA
jgi:precorrin-6A/cobalt-precorrin-6A reductase